MELYEVLGWTLSVIVILIGCLLTFLYWFLSRMFDSIQLLPPTKVDQNPLAGNNQERNPLFRHIPSLRKKLAWAELGVFPTPIHQAQLEKSGKRITFWMKREDLSSPIYGGNKVRTLQYQLATCQAHLEQHPSAKFYVMGSGGSNQVVATMVHGATLGLNFNVCYSMPDGPDLDNTLNLLSTLSFQPESLGVWDKSLAQTRRLLGVLTSKHDRAFGLGGNSIGGILGQIGGALELAEQIAAGELPDVDEIYLPMGSSCTTTGLIMGVCLARHLKLRAFQSPRFKIVSVAIHGGFAALNRKTGVLRNWAGQFISVSPRFGIHRTAAFLKALTGIDIQDAALNFLQQEWEVVDEAEYAGTYGVHSARSAAASAFDEKLEVSGPCPRWIPTSSSPPIPWLCGHFTGKSFAVMLDRLEAANGPLNVLLWQTKSNIQPLGAKQDEWSAIKQKAGESKVLKEWSEKGKAASVLRPGKVDLENGTPSDYRPIMTRVLE